MLNSIRKFSNTLWAKILLCIVIVPFVFWGMGNVFSGGNKNIIAKINNKKISTQDFMNHINKLKVFNPELSVKNVGLWKKNVDNNAIKEIELHLREFCYK